jgi:hypothetical protein
MYLQSISDSILAIAFTNKSGDNYWIFFAARKVAVYNFSLL